MPRIFPIALSTASVAPSATHREPSLPGLDRDARCRHRVPREEARLRRPPGPRRTRLGRLGGATDQSGNHHRTQADCSFCLTALPGFHATTDPRSFVAQPPNKRNAGVTCGATLRTSCRIDPIFNLTCLLSPAASPAFARFRIAEIQYRQDDCGGGANNENAEDSVTASTYLRSWRSAKPR
jgi:hypothetical protein